MAGGLRTRGGNAAGSFGRAARCDTDGILNGAGTRDARQQGELAGGGENRSTGAEFRKPKEDEKAGRVSGSGCPVWRRCAGGGAAMLPAKSPAKSRLPAAGIRGRQGRWPRPARRGGAGQIAGKESAARSGYPRPARPLAPAGAPRGRGPGRRAAEDAPARRGWPAGGALIPRPAAARATTG